MDAPQAEHEASRPQSGEPVVPDACPALSHSPRPAPTVIAGHGAVAPAAPKRGGHGWTFILMSIGIAAIACSLLLPESDENRRLVYECAKLKIDLAHLQQQVTVNGEFISRLGNDPALSERLAQRQMKFIRKGTSVVSLDEPADNSASPFALVAIPPPPQLPEFRPAGGALTSLFRDDHTRLRIIGGGLMLVAAGLVLGTSARE